MARGQASRQHVEIEGRELTLSNLDKVLYPAAGFRKADVIDYYRRIAPWVLPHLAQRPPTLVRAPDGPDGPRFFELFNDKIALPRDDVAAPRFDLCQVCFRLISGSFANGW